MGHPLPRVARANRWVLPILVATFTMLSGSSTLAQNAAPITLKSADGTLEFLGKLVGFDGKTYEIETNFGVFRVSADMVECFGAACPS